MGVLEFPDHSFSGKGITACCGIQPVPNSFREGNLLWEFVPFEKAGSCNCHFFNRAYNISVQSISMSGQRLPPKKLAECSVFS